MADAKENLVRVARALRRLGLADAVFVGGATVESYITDPALLAPRVTLDVDVVVDATTRHQFYGIEARESLLAEVRDMSPEPREFIRSSLRDLLADASFAFVIHAHLPPDDASQERAASVLARLRQLAAG